MYSSSEKKKEQGKNGNDNGGRGDNGKNEKNSEKWRGKPEGGGDGIVRRRDEEYYPLNKSRAAILEEIKGKPFFTRPNKLP